MGIGLRFGGGQGGCDRKIEVSFFENYYYFFFLGGGGRVGRGGQGGSE